MQLSHKYAVERMALKSKITALCKKLSESGKQQQRRESFILAVRRFMQMDYLTAPLLRGLADTRQGVAVEYLTEPKTA